MTFKGLRIFFRPDNTNRRCVGAFALLFFTVLICINFRIQRVTETRYLSGTQVRKTGNGIPVVNHGRIMEIGFAPIFPDICYHLTHYKPAAADIPVASDNPAHYADAIRYNARTPLQGSLLPLTRLVWA